MNDKGYVKLTGFGEHHEAESKGKMADQSFSLSSDGIYISPE